MKCSLRPFHRQGAKAPRTEDRSCVSFEFFFASLRLGGEKNLRGLRLPNQEEEVAFLRAIANAPETACKVKS